VQFLPMGRGCTAERRPSLTQVAKWMADLSRAVSDDAVNLIAHAQQQLRKVRAVMSHETEGALGH
jgi:hypothetical protein